MKSTGNLGSRTRQQVKIATSTTCALLLLILSVCLSFLLQQNKTSGSTSKHRSSVKNRGALQLALHPVFLLSCSATP